ncbi:sensor histidine kinase [Aeromicrobium piscarium]|uniref:sensor histidine kinase n=1 Tax=Aeromicrobium piscarium TaxID=2590901 RepID=UPI00163D676B|nr:histidine kinase [Aeromicrobium piscarium]
MTATPERESPPAIGRWRGTFYVSAVGVRTLVAMAVVAALGTPIAVALADGDRAAAGGRGTGGVGVLVVAGLALLGAGLPLVAGALATADWHGSAALLNRPMPGVPVVRFTEPRTLIRPMAYATVMLTLGGAAAVPGFLVVVGSAVTVAGPVLVANGDQIVIGPFTIDTLPESLLAALIGLALLTTVVLASPSIARWHASLVAQALTRPEQRLQLDLAMTARSRTRLVRAFDVERRRIERDLHDGVQPQLMSVSMTLGLALADMPAGAPGREDVVRAQDQTRRTLEAMRRFVRNIHPQVLVDHGLGAAVGELADTLTLPIAVEDRLPHRLPADVETSLYFCAAELLTNVVKHSGADHAEVRLDAMPDGSVRVSVRDDGGGGAGSAHHDGGGLAGIADRIAAFDGTLVVDSPLGGPTTVTITLAISEEDPDE